MSNYWFKRRRYGWGWVPVRWQGWLVLLAFIGLLLAGSMTIQDNPTGTLSLELVFYLLFVAIGALVLFFIIVKTAPAPKWRWGTKDTDNPDEDF